MFVFVWYSVAIHQVNKGILGLLFGTVLQHIKLIRVIRVIRVIRIIVWYSVAIHQANKGY